MLANAFAPGPFLDFFGATENAPSMPVALLFEFVRTGKVQSNLERHAEQLSALGHPVRLSILRFVVQGGEGGTAAGEIQGHVDMPASTLSHHLKRLVDAGLLKSRTEGTFHYYAPELAALRALTDYVWEDCCKRGKARRCC